MKGHYVPEFYLKRFRNPAGKLWVYFHDEGWKLRSSGDTASEQDYYSPELENAYNKIETPAANILDKTVFRKEKLTQERREVLAYFFALLQLRTPMFFNSLEQPLSELMYMLTSTYHQFYSENPTAFEETKKEMAADGEPLPDWFKPEHIDPKAFKISPTKDLIFGTGLESAETSAGLLNGMTWNFLTTTEEKPFITSDNPLCDLTFENGQLVNAGLGHPNVRVFVPLSSTMALSAEWEKGHEYFYLEVEESLVEQVNLRVMANSGRFIVASRQDFPGVPHLTTMVRE
ncbi:MAG TPA: DUF4238 domain-containing protein [Thermoanaerobaculia bacterium]|nr:DUF4238 domain-containing protein [Thermoanaerobaculia bacterium]